MQARDHRKLIQRYRDGDAGAFAQLFERYEANLAARVGRRLPFGLQRKVSVADVVQEVRLVALERCADFDGAADTDLRRWLFGIADNKVRDAVRHHRAGRRAADQEVTRGARADTRDVAGHEASPSQNAVAAETRELVQRAFAELSVDHRQVLRLVREERLDLAEAAKRLGRSYDATRKLYGRALERLTHAFGRLAGGRDG